MLTFVQFVEIHGRGTEAGVFRPASWSRTPDLDRDGRTRERVQRVTTAGFKLDPGRFAPADPPRLRSRGPVAPLRSGGRACGPPSPLCGSLRKRGQSSRFEPHNGLNSKMAGREA